MDRTYIDEDFVRVFETTLPRARVVVTLAFGDEVKVLGAESGFTRVQVLTHYDGQATGYVKGSPRLRRTGVLKFSMVDVQQGDGLVLESPSGKVVLVDGGDNKLFARHVAERFRHRNGSSSAPVGVDAIVVTHGDADHFAGLSEIVDSERLPAAKARKRLFLKPQRLFHNGIVKGPSSLPDEQQLGRTAVDARGWPLVTGLYDDPRTAPPAAMNAPFKAWMRSLDHWGQRGPITARRLAFGMDGTQAFDFLAADGVRVDILGPVTETVQGPDGHAVPALRFLPTPEKSAEMHVEAPAGSPTSPSASHTINGHSVALRVTYGNVRLQLTGDLNRDAMDVLRRTAPELLEAEIVKIPHHGSHDFDFAALEAMRPVVAIISSGDEHAGKEHIHPRATLMAASGKVMRGKTGLVFCTELAAFFAVRDLSFGAAEMAAYFRSQGDASFTARDLAALFAGRAAPEGFPKSYFGFERTNFGIVHVRTDGERVLVFTHSGKAGLNEAYRFSVTVDGEGRRSVKFAKRISSR